MEISNKIGTGENIVKRFFIIILVLFILATLFSSTIRNMSLPRVTIAEVKTGNVVRYVSFPGKIILENSQREYLGVSLKVEKVYVKVGDEVGTGADIAIINKDSVSKALNTKQLEILKAKNELDTLEYNLKIAKADLDLFSGESYLLKSRSEHDQAQINYNKAKDDYEKNKPLYESGIISKQELNDYSDKLNIASNNYDLAKKSFEDSKLRAPLEKARLESEVNSKESELELANKVYKDMISQDDYKALQEIEKSSYKILSKYSGVVTELNLSEGKEISLDTPLFAVDSSGDYSVEINVGSKDMQYLKENTEVNVRFLYKNIETVKGTISRINLADDPIKSNSNTSYKVLIEIDKERIEPSIIKLGDDVEIRTIYQEFCKNIIPYSAIVEQYNDRLGKLEKYLYVIDEKKDVFGTIYKAKMIKVNTGAEGDSEVQIIEGLNGDEKVIINPSYTLKNGEGVVIE